MTERKETQWCCLCGARFTEAEVEGATCCPRCGDGGVPCDAAKDLTVRVNWLELRILGIWAENWAQHCQRTAPNDPGGARPAVIHAITRRIERQHPGNTPLTLSGEIIEVKQHGMGVESYGVAKPSAIPVNGPGAAGN